jgi:hypothetical protein
MILYPELIALPDVGEGLLYLRYLSRGEDYNNRVRKWGLSFHTHSLVSFIVYRV